MKKESQKLTHVYSLCFNELNAFLLNYFSGLFWSFLAFLVKIDFFGCFPLVFLNHQAILDLFQRTLLDH